MSNWTHVAGVIRVDSFRFEPLEFDELIGKECLFSSPDELWDEYYAHPERFLPMGSEGTLRKTVWDNPNKNHVAAYTVTIFGDLRDHDDPKKIIDWFKEKCSHLCVRNALITAENELNGTTTWVYEDD